MNIKRAWATFILIATIFISSNVYYIKEIEDIKYKQELRDSEIANLKDDLKIEVENLKRESEKNLKLINEQSTIITNQNKKIEDLDKKVNFKKAEKGVDVGGRKLNVEMTAYIAKCREGCTGITATGIDIRGITTYQGHRIIATDPNIIPLYSIVRVEVNGESFTAISLDTGGAIKGHIVDFLVNSTSEARKFGRKQATVTILREGE